MYDNGDRLVAWKDRDDMLCSQGYRQAPNWDRVVPFTQPRASEPGALNHTLPCDVQAWAAKTIAVRGSRTMARRSHRY